jgi:N-acyl-D-amino-acid deacylase
VTQLNIVNGTIIDGTGTLRYQANIAVEDGTIARITGEELPPAERTIDAEGCLVTPGFIDMHSHSDLRLFDEPVPVEKVSQGITTELLGQDGLGPAPVTDETVGELAGFTAGLLGPRPKEQWHWRSFEDYLRALDDIPLPSNQVLLASHGPLRLMAMGAEDRQATPEELEDMQALLRRNLEQGAPGLSTGLIYPPAAYAPEEELRALTEVVGEFDGVFVVHLRDEGYYLLRALKEVIRVCKQSECKLHVSHLQAYGEVNWHLLPQALELIEEARADGLPVTCDRYPYLAGCTVLSAVLPPWVLDGGPQASLARLRDEEERAKIHEWFEKGLDVWNNRSISVGWENIQVTWVASDENSWAEGLNITQIARRQDKHPVDAACDLLAQEELQVTMITYYGSEENLERIYSREFATVGTDGIFGGRPHPRLWGSYGRFFGHYVRDRGLMTPEEAVRRVTGLPAEILGLEQRGKLQEGFPADIVVLDPETVEGPATYDDPKQFSRGLRAVIVNGKLAWQGKWRDGGEPGTHGTVLRT